jgi:transglutaminase-like putative cysteine protease
MTASTSVRPPPPGFPPSSPPPAAETGLDTPTSIGPTFLTAAAVLTGASALSSPISGHTWVLPLIEVVSVIWLVGVGGRLIRLPTAVTVLLQLAGFVIALTSLFTSSGIGGVLPNPAAINEAGTLLSGAWAQIVGSAPPAPSTPELSFLISLAVGVAAFIADFLVAEARSPALVALPLLCLYSVPASISSTMLPWYTFAVPAVIYAVLLAVTGHRDRRTGVRAGVGLAINGGAITVLATAAALLIAGSVTVIGTTGRLPHTSGTNGGAIGLSPFAALRGNLRSSDPVNVLTASGLASPDYFRTVALDKWTPNQGWSLGELNADVSNVNGPLTSSAPVDTESDITVNPTGFNDRFLPILTGTTSVSGLTDSWNFDAALDTVYRTDKVRPAPYSISVDQAKPSVATLEADSVVSGGDLTETGSLADSVRSKALKVTATASGAFDKALALEQWFTNPADGFVYSLNVPTGNSGDALVDFLTNKQGYCEQYASAMAIMLRSLNIPTRVVVGFTQGVRQADGSYLITSHDAHAWVEVKFQDNGWVRFDPTPPVGGQGGQQGFQEQTAPPTTQTVATTAVQRTAPTTNNRLGTTTSARTSSAVATQVDVAAGGGKNSTSGWIKALLLVIVVLVVVIGLLMLPTALRAGRRRRRLQLSRAGGPGAAAAAWAEIEDTAIDHGIVPHSSESARVSANRLARRAHLDEVGRLRLRAIVVAAEREWYGVTGSATPAAGLPSPPGPEAGSAEGPGPSGTTVTLSPPKGAPSGAELAAGVTSVVRGLHQNAPVRLSERLFPRSMRRARV